MPVVRFHVTAGTYATEQLQALLRAAGAVYADVLDSPVERVRCLVQTYEPELSLVGGELVSAGAPPAPYFELVVLTGRPLEQRQRLLRRFTELVVEHLGADGRLVRGRAIEVAPEDWAIAGVPASTHRRAEIADRAAGAGQRIP